MEFKRGDMIYAAKPIRLANGITLEVGSRGIVIGVGSYDTVSVQFDDYIGGVSVWANLIGFMPADELAPAQPATADAGAEIEGVDKLGIIEHYLREGKLLNAFAAHRRFYGSDIHEARIAVEQVKYDMKLREDSKPTYSELQAKLAAAEALAATNASLLANAQSELDTVRGERDAAMAALRPFAFAYHVFNDQFVSEYGNIINWQTDFANPNKVTEWYKQASEVVGVEAVAYTFKAGDKVIVTGTTPYESFEGCEGVIIRKAEFHDWLIDVTFPDGNHDELGYNEKEIQLANG